MTLHTKAATDDILDIFNQPLKNVDLLSSQAESAGESDYEDDDYTSAGESTGTGRISGPSEFGEDETTARDVINHDETEDAIISPWSDFTSSKHVPRVDMDDTTAARTSHGSVQDEFTIPADNTATSCEDGVNLVAPTSPRSVNIPLPTRFIPLPPEDYESSNRPFRDPSQAQQNRLPFMTPIVEKTESSMGALTNRTEKDYFSSKTPSKRNNNGLGFPETCNGPESSPFKEIFNDARLTRVKSQSPSGSKSKVSKPVAGCSRPTSPIIKDIQCNPNDDIIRQTVLNNLQPPLESYNGYFDYRTQSFNKGPEIRRFVKALNKIPKNGTDKTASSLSIPPILQFPSLSTSTYSVKRELGKGAFAPVYLVQEDVVDESQKTTSPSQLLALKCEDPPTPWEFYIMSTLHERLSTLPSSRQSTSLLRPHALHIFSDEGYLLEQYLDQGTLLDLVNLAKHDSSGVLDESIAMFFTVELLRTMEDMHTVGILHGDLKADNCLVRLLPCSTNSFPSSSTERWDSEYHASGDGGWFSKGLCLIDFGRGIDMHHFTPDVQFIADWKTGKADCAEMREMRPWTWQVDYWGMAGVAHSLLFGKYIEDVAIDINSRDGGIGSTAARGSGTASLGASARKWKLKEPLKRYWQTDLWAPLFDALLNPASYAADEDGGKMPIMRTLKGCRERMEAWLEKEGGRKGLKVGLRRLEERIREKRVR